MLGIDMTAWCAVSVGSAGPQCLASSRLSSQSTPRRDRSLCPWATGPATWRLPRPGTKQPSAVGYEDLPSLIPVSLPADGHSSQGAYDLLSCQTISGPVTSLAHSLRSPSSHVRISQDFALLYDWVTGWRQMSLSSNAWVSDVH